MTPLRFPRKAWLVLALFALFALAACDNMRDNNGDLGGMWQLTEWRDKATLEVKANKDSAIYYSFHRDLMKIQNYRHKGAEFFMYFTHAGQTLTVDSAYQFNPRDKRVPLDDLAPYGVPADGRFSVLQLTDERLVLDAPTHTLTFRKY